MTSTTRAPNKAHHSLTDAMRIAGEAQVALNTFRRWERGDAVRPVSALRITEAIKRLATTKRRRARP